MPVGIEIKRTDGTTMIGPDTRVSKILGRGYTNGTNAGAFDVPEWANAPGWLAITSVVNYNDGWTLPDVYKEALRISWSRRAGGSAPTAGVWIMWGTY
jgi:hypothetical protein